jgi:hypothetical protein
MLPSEFPEVQASVNLKRLLKSQVDMQFQDLRTLLELPRSKTEGGCNLTAAAVLFNLIAGASVCFYDASPQAFRGRGDRGIRFVGVLTRFYPWDPRGGVTPAEAAAFIYESARNPLAHSLGLEPPAPTGSRRTVMLRKWALSPDQVWELENASTRPKWTRALISEVERRADVITKATISIPALYFGVCRMLRALFRDPEQLAKTEAVAGEFVRLWPQYAAGGAYVLFRRRRR